MSLYQQWLILVINRSTQVWLLELVRFWCLARIRLTIFHCIIIDILILYQEEEVIYANKMVQAIKVGVVCQKFYNSKFQISAPVSLQVCAYSRHVSMHICQWRGGPYPLSPTCRSAMAGVWCKFKVRNNVNSYK